MELFENYCVCLGQKEGEDESSKIVPGQSGGGRPRLAIVDYLRAICIIFVILNHSGLFDRAMPLFTLTIDKAVPVFMILSGYVFALVASEKTFRELYGFSSMKKKFIRFTLPMVITFGFYLMLKRLGGNPLTLSEMFKAVALGNWGQGAYYYHLMIEFMFLAPVLYGIIRRFEAEGIILIGLVNFICEVLCSTYGLHVALYRVLIFRYLFAIGLGIYIGRFKERKISPVICGTITVVGVVYILLPYIWGYSYRIFTYSPWGRTSMVSVLYVFPIVYILLDGFSGYHSQGFFGKAVERIGRASYYIMYAQMIYYVVRPTFDRTIFDISGLGTLELMIDVAVPILFGIMFEWVMATGVTACKK